MNQISTWILGSSQNQIKLSSRELQSNQVLKSHTGRRLYHLTAQVRNLGIMRETNTSFCSVLIRPPSLPDKSHNHMLVLIPWVIHSQQSQKVVVTMENLQCRIPSNVLNVLYYQSQLPPKEGVKSNIGSQLQLDQTKEEDGG